MEAGRKITALIVMGLWLATAVFLHGCAPHAVVKLDTPEHHVLSGMKLLKLERYTDALREFELTKGFAPAFSKAYVGSALVHGNTGNWERGLEEVKRAGDLAKTDEEKVFAGIGLIRLYLIDQETVPDQWLEKAESAYHDAVTLLPESSEAHYYMGETYKKAMDFENARKLFEKVLRLDDTFTSEATRALSLMKNQQRK